jgi:hypothetical protein
MVRFMISGVLIVASILLSSWAISTGPLISAALYGLAAVAGFFSLYHAIMIAVKEKTHK